MKMNYYITLVLLALSTLGLAQNKNFIDQPFIETSAVVDTLVTPDRIYLDILISEKDTKGKISVEELEEKLESTLISLGVNTQEDLVLNDLTSNFRRYYIKAQDVLKNKSYTLLVKDAQTAGRVIVELEKIDISNVSLNRIEYSRIEELRLELKTKAVIKAKKQAEYMTTALNQKLGAAIHIKDFSENSLDKLVSYDSYSSESFRLFQDGSTEFKLADIQFGKIKVENGVSVKFKLIE